DDARAARALRDQDQGTRRGDEQNSASGLCRQRPSVEDSAGRVRGGIYDQLYESDLSGMRSGISRFAPVREAEDRGQMPVLRKRISHSASDEGGPPEPDAVG